MGPLDPHHSITSPWFNGDIFGPESYILLGCKAIYSMLILHISAYIYACIYCSCFKYKCITLCKLLYNYTTNYWTIEQNDYITMYIYIYIFIIVCIYVYIYIYIYIVCLYRYIIYPPPKTSILVGPNCDKDRLSSVLAMFFAWKVTASVFFEALSMAKKILLYSSIKMVDFLWDTLGKLM